MVSGNAKPVIWKTVLDVLTLPSCVQHMESQPCGERLVEKEKPRSWTGEVYFLNLNLALCKIKLKKSHFYTKMSFQLMKCVKNLKELL